MKICCLYIIVLLNVIIYTNTLPIPTTCPDQLKRFYVDLGLPLIFPLQLPFNFTSGIFMGTPFVSIGINVQTAALTYANGFSYTPLPNNSYVSIDIPYCWTNITYSCVNRIIYGITKTNPNCTLLLDRDISEGSSIAGRLFVYPNPDPPCDGNAIVTFYNTLLLPPASTSLYSYDIEGIYNGILKTETNAIFTYRNAFCDYSDGNVSDALVQQQFMCEDSTLQCASPRPVNNEIISPVYLTAEFRCHNSDGGPFRSAVRVINHNESSIGIESEFDLRFIALDTGLLLPSVYERQLIKPQIIRQFTILSPFINYNISTAFGGYNYSSYSLTMPPIPSQYLSSIPCICGLTINCIGGSIDTSQAGTTFFLNNTYPIALANTSTPVLRRGDTAYLHDNGSYDPDMYPGNLSYYWIHAFGPDDINITINDPSNPLNASFVTFPYTMGIYTMLLLVCDGQDCNYTDINITAVDIYPACIVPPSINGQINQTIYLDATKSIDGLNVTLNATWFQLTGFPVVIDNNYTLLANFTAIFSGTYVFQVNITNGIANCSFQMIVNVDPMTFAPIIDNSTLPPFQDPDNRTNPPIDINETDIPLATDPPFDYPTPNSTFSPAPTGSTPVFPPAPFDPIGWHNFLIWFLISIFSGIDIIFILWVLYNDTTEKYKLVIVNNYLRRI
jgi:hypothetical protein